MALKRRKLLAQGLNLGYGTDTVPDDSGGTRIGDLIGIHTFLPKVVHIRDFGALCDGVTDDAAAIQLAIDAICPTYGAGTRAGIVLGDPYNPSMIKTTLNLTNSRSGGTKVRDGIRFLDFNLIGETGPGTAMIETTGSQFAKIRGKLISGTNTRSTVGIYQGLASANPQTQNQIIQCEIEMHDDATANANNGTVALWVFGAEENTYIRCYLTANVPLYLTGQGSAGIISYSNSYQTLSASHSCGLNTFIGETFLVGLNKRSYSMITEDINSVDMQNVYFANSGTGGSVDCAWYQQGAFGGGQIRGNIEFKSMFAEVHGTIRGLRARLTQGTIDNSSSARIDLRRGGEGRLIDSDITFTDTVSPNRPIFSISNLAGANDVVSCFIRNSTIRSNCRPADAVIPENVKWNPFTGNVTLEVNDTNDGGTTYNMPWRYWIGNRHDRLDIPTKNVWVSGGISEAEVLRFICPTVFSTANALAATIKLSGVLSMAVATTGGQVSKYIEAICTIAVHNDGTIYVSSSGNSPTSTAADLVISGTAASVSVASNAITDVVVKQTIVSNTYVQIIVTPTRSGANADTVQCALTAELFWHGNESRAPHLELV